MQEHLTRIADYLKIPCIWWEHNAKTNDVTFYDGDNEPSFRSQGPYMKDFTSCSLVSALNDVEEAWNFCIQENILLPIEKLNIFDENGEKVSDKEHIPYNYEEINMECEDQEHDDHETELELHSNILDEGNKEDSDQKLAEEEQKQEQHSEPKNVKQPEQNKKQTPHKYKSNIGKMLSQVLGHTRPVQLFDKHHNLFRVLKSEESRKYCQELLPSLQQKTLQQHKILNDSMDSWNRSFFLEKEREPNATDIKGDNKALSIYQGIKSAKKLLKGWEITF